MVTFVPNPLSYKRYTHINFTLSKFSCCLPHINIPNSVKHSLTKCWNFCLKQVSSLESQYWNIKCSRNKIKKSEDHHHCGGAIGSPIFLYRFTWPIKDMIYVNETKYTVSIWCWVNEMKHPQEADVVHLKTSHNGRDRKQTQNRMIYLLQINADLLHWPSSQTLPFSHLHMVEDGPLGSEWAFVLFLFVIPIP